MVTNRGKLIGTVLLSSLFFFSSEARSVTATSGTIFAFTSAGFNIAGPDFALNALVNVWDSVAVSDCLICLPGQPFGPFMTFIRINGTLTWQGIDYQFQQIQEGNVTGRMAAGGFYLPSEVGPAFSAELPFTFFLGIPQLNFFTSGSGILPVTFSPNGGTWARSGLTYYVGASVPEPSAGWLLLGGLPMLVGGGWLVRRSRAAGTCTTPHY